MTANDQYQTSESQYFTIMLGSAGGDTGGCPLDATISPDDYFNGFETLQNIAFETITGNLPSPTIQESDCFAFVEAWFVQYDYSGQEVTSSEWSNSIFADINTMTWSITIPDGVADGYYYFGLMMQVNDTDLSIHE